jgi:hypothetical protein
VPEYQVAGNWFDNDHYDGGFLFRDKINFEAIWDKQQGWTLLYGFDSQTPNLTSEAAAVESLPDGAYRFKLPVVQDTEPGITATLRIETRRWNQG